MSIQHPKTISTKPGVYTFHKGKMPIYIGKAANLKKRLVSYFKKEVSEKVRQLRHEATSLDWIETSSEVEALIKEAELIKNHTPKFNVLMRDDKNYFYVVITNEDFPRIFLTHQPWERSKNQEARIKRRNLNSKFLILNSSYVGPFTSGSALKATLRLLRGLFPYCTCKELHKRPCLNAEIGRCPGFCCLKVNRELKKTQRAEYLKNINTIVGILSGRRKKILSELTKTMRQAAKSEDFEQATKLRNQMLGLENIFSHAMLVNRALLHRPLHWEKIQQNLQIVLGTKITRAEGYDISHISGTEATGSMVVFINGRPAKAEYRMFGIKTIHQPNDVAMHQEVMRRRLRHHEWPYPELILIDGGRAQLTAGLWVVRREFPRLRIKIAALAKREEELYTENRDRPIPLKTLPPDTALFLQHIRDESHRFAKKYHHKRREVLYRNH